MDKVKLFLLLLGIGFASLSAYLYIENYVLPKPVVPYNDYTLEVIPSKEKSLSLGDIETPQPDKQWREGCEWKEFVSTKLGIKFYYQSECDATTEAYKYNFYESGNSIYYKAVRYDGLEDTSKVIEVFTKDKDVLMADDIKAKFIDSMSKLDQNIQNCSVEQSNNVPREGYEVYQLAIDQSKMSENQYMQYYMGNVPACGGMFDGNWVGYFLYDPMHSQTRYAHLTLGQEPPPFDPATIVMAD